MAKQKPRKTLRVLAVIFIILFLGGGVAFFIFSDRTTTFVSDISESSSYISLICQTDNHPMYTIYGSHHDKTVTAHYETRATFSGEEKLKNIYFSYKGIFASPEEAESAEASMHAEYNIYVGTIGANIEDFSPTYNALDSSVRISHYAEGGSMYQSINPVFLLPSDTEYTLGSLKSSYENQKFTCEVSHKNIK